ncbi:MAG: FadR family transcriptional regulator [Anaerotruncus sp.]|nr:FadR family transcriptional regulator [Anaerotruncus sp.]
MADEIKQEILSGALEEETRLPSEAEYAEMFGVNRLSIRLALEKLSTLGLIETRVGVGSFVKKISLAPMFMELSEIYETEDGFLDVMQFRYLLESDSIRRAEKFSTTEEKDELKTCLAEYHKNWCIYSENVDDKEQLKKTAESDYNFHYQIVKMSHNRLYADLYYMIRDLMLKHISRQLWVTSHRLKEIGATVPYENETHIRIYHAIMDGDETVIENLCEKMVGIHSVDELAEFEDKQIQKNHTLD